MSELLEWIFFVPKTNDEELLQKQLLDLEREIKQLQEKTRTMCRIYVLNKQAITAKISEDILNEILITPSLFNKFKILRLPLI